MKKIYLLGIAFLVGVLVSASFYVGLFSGLENFLEDLLFSPRPFNPDIVIIDIDSKSIQKIGQWPWPRKVFAEALLKIDQTYPKIVGVDVIFSEPSRLGSTDDYALATALEKLSYPVILPAEATSLTLKNGELSQSGIFLKPMPIFEKAKGVSLGHVNLILDRDGIVRRLPLSVDFLRSFGYEIVKKSGWAIPDEQSLESITRIVYSAPTRTIRRIPFWRLLEEDLGNQLLGKIVLIGSTAVDLHDEKPTPFSRGTQMSGVEIQANIVNMLLSGYRLQNLSATASITWIFLTAVIPVLIFTVFRRSLMPIFMNIILGIIYLIIIILLFDRGIAVNILHINFAWIISTASLFSYRYFSTEKERKEMKNLFSKYVSKDVLEEILRDPTKVKLGGEEKEVTVFFSDIRGFTTLSEKTTPSELVRILNKYFTLMTNEVLKNGGVLDKYIGDAIMAFWGAPIDDQSQADNALKAALGMLDKLKELPEINIGIGLYTGPAIVGNVGSDLRFDYTVIGDTVNVASRLEGLNKEYKTQIIIGETTKNKIKGNYKFKFLGSIAVKGRKEPLNIYTVEI